MSYDFAKAADEFLEVTDKAYDECSEGISELDKIIVASPSALVGKTRGYLKVCLYAYWERFFRIAFGEYLRCLTLVQLDFADVNDKLGQWLVRRELVRFSERHKVGKLHEMSDRFPPIVLKRVLRSLVKLLESPMSFRFPDEWIETESNVRFRVLERHCDRFGVDLEAIKAAFDGTSSLFQLLENFVDERNDLAHGASFRETPQWDWEQDRSFVLKLIQTLQFELFETLADGHLLLRGITVDTEFQI